MLVQPTPYTDVNEALEWLLSQTREILGSRFNGMYVYGSLALGDFSPHGGIPSDIDLVTVTDAELAEGVVLALRDMHARFDAAGSRWATQVECVYVPRGALRRFDPDQGCYPHIQRGETLDMDCIDCTWIPQLHVLREYGIVLAGPEPRTLIEPFSPEDLRRSMVRGIEGWPAQLCREPLPLGSWGLRGFTVLTMCRMLHTLETGTVVPKRVAARWAQGKLPGPMAVLIDWALAPTESGVDAAAGSVNATLNLIRYVREHCRQWDTASRHSRK
jgi:hypothetical protein